MAKLPSDAGSLGGLESFSPRRERSVLNHSVKDHLGDTMVSAAHAAMIIAMQNLA
jgi:hypothetical protein